MASKSDREQIQKLARAARDQYLRLSEQLDRLTREAPSRGGVPSSDGIQTIVTLGKQRDVAFEKYINALSRFTVASVAPAKDEDRVSLLSPREREVIMLVASGKSSKEVASILGIAFKTVVVHRHNAQKKLGVHKATELTRAAVRLGLIDP